MMTKNPRRPIIEKKKAIILFLRRVACTTSLVLIVQLFWLIEFYYSAHVASEVEKKCQKEAVLSGVKVATQQQGQTIGTENLGQTP